MTTRSGAEPSTPRRALDGFGADLRRAAGHHQGGQGPGSYGRLTSALADLADAADPVLSPLAEAWKDRAFSAWYERPLLLLASLRYLALGDHGHDLAPELLLDATADHLDERVREALADPALPEIVRSRRVQTNEPGRAVGWGLVAMALELPHRGFALADLGCSAGLNLLSDLVPTSWRIGRSQVSGLDFPTPRDRLGLDRSPIDATDPDAVRWLRACVWPGDRERVARLDASLDAIPRVSRTIEAHSLGEGATGRRLAQLGEPVLAFQSVVGDYLPADVAAAHEADMLAWLGGDRHRIWARLEPDATPGNPAPMRLEVLVVRAGEPVSVTLGFTGYHPGAVQLVAGATEALTRCW